MPLNSSRFLLMVVLCLSALAQASVPVARVEPACPETPMGKSASPARVTIRYNPASPGATLKLGSAVNLVVGGVGPGWGDTLLRIPMARGRDGGWVATVEPKPKQSWVYLMFYFQDDRGRVDDNRNQYWDVLGCYKGIPEDQGVDYQARSYTGMVFGSGIQRKRDYKRAVAILESDLRAHPEHSVNLLSHLWGYKVERDGGGAGAYRKISREVERFLDEHAKNRFMLVAAGNFLGNRHLPLSSRLREKYLVLLRPYEPEYADFKRAQELDAAWNEPDPATKVKLCRQFIANYPDDVWAFSMYPMIFRTQVQDRLALNDLPGGEETFRAWTKAEPANPDAYASMAHAYIDRGEKLHEAERLLARAFELYTGERPKGGRRLFSMIEVGFQPERDQAWLGFLRGKLRLLEGKPQEALPDLEAAAQFFQGRQEVWFTLGQAQERAAMKENAIRSYIEAATVPAQVNSEARDALDRLFAGEGGEGAARLEKMLETRLMERRVQATAEYTPTPIQRELPDFRVTTLAGRELTARRLRGRPAIINVWAAWCFGCMIELPGLDEFQRTHRDLTVLAVAWSSEPEDVRTIAKQKKLSALQIAVSDALERELGDSGVPTTFVVDRKGRIRFVHNDLPDVMAILEKDLAYLAAEK